VKRNFEKKKRFSEKDLEVSEKSAYLCTPA
jgi:hypothetical protein